MVSYYMAVHGLFERKAFPARGSRHLEVFRMSIFVLGFVGLVIVVLVVGVAVMLFWRKPDE